MFCCVYCFAYYVCVYVCRCEMSSRAVKVDSPTPNKSNASTLASTENLLDVVVPVVVHFRLGQRPVPVRLVRLVVFNVGELVVLGRCVVLLFVGSVFVFVGIVVVVVGVFFAGQRFHVVRGGSCRCTNWTTSCGWFRCCCCCCCW